MSMTANSFHTRKSTDISLLHSPFPFMPAVVVYVRASSLLTIFAALCGFLSAVGAMPGTPSTSFGVGVISCAVTLLASGLFMWSTNPSMALALHERARPLIVQTNLREDKSACLMPPLATQAPGLHPIHRTTGQVNSSRDEK